MINETYKGRKIKVKLMKDRHGGKYVQVTVNGQFFANDSNVTEEKSLSITRGYIDSADERPGAFPVLDIHPWFK